MIHIVTDSSCDLPEEFLKKHNIPFVPLTIRFKAEEFKERINISTKEFFKKMAGSDTLPQTTQPSPAAFLEVFEAIASPNDEILCITISSKLSGTFQSANVAKTMASVPITVFDSLGASPAHALQIIKAVQLRDLGHSMDEIVADLTCFRDNDMKILIYFETLENIVKGGRITKFQGTLAKVMNIKLIGGGVKGEIVPLEKVRGSKRALEQLISIVGKKEEDFSDRIFCLTHAENQKDAEFIKTELIKRYNPKGVLIYPIGPVIGTYAGSGGIVLSF